MRVFKQLRVVRSRGVQTRLLQSARVGCLVAGLGVDEPVHGVDRKRDEDQSRNNLLGRGPELLLLSRVQCVELASLKELELGLVLGIVRSLKALPNCLASLLCAPSETRKRGGLS